MAQTRRFGSSVERIEFISLTGLGFKLSHSSQAVRFLHSMVSFLHLFFSLNLIAMLHHCMSPIHHHQHPSYPPPWAPIHIQATHLRIYNPFSISANPHPPWPIHTQHTHTHLGRSTSTMPTPTLADPHPTYPHLPWLIYTHHAHTHLAQSKSHIPTPTDPHLRWKYTWEPEGVERRVETRETWDWDLRVERTKSDFWKSEILISKTQRLRWWDEIED